MLTWIILIFVVGYLAIALEHQLHINKAASAILTGVLCWTLYAINFNTLVPQEAYDAWHNLQGATDEGGGIDPKLHYLVDGQLSHLFSETAGILFFLIGAMTIVELVDAHEGFSLITRYVRSKNKVTLLWVIGICTFFFSTRQSNDNHRDDFRLAETCR